MNKSTGYLTHILFNSKTRMYFNLIILPNSSCLWSSKIEHIQLKINYTTTSAKISRKENSYLHNTEKEIDYTYYGIVIHCLRESIPHHSHEL